VAASPLLKPAARRLIEAADEVYVSAASIWEAAIKARLGKLAADPHEPAAAIEPSGFIELPCGPRTPLASGRSNSTTMTLSTGSCWHRRWPNR